LKVSPLAGRRIVITRPEPDAAPLAARLEALGAVPIVVPTIRIEFADPAPLDAALSNLRAYDWIIFTSRNGVEAVFRRTQAISGPRVAAIGRATATELERRGVRPDAIPDEFVAEAILEKLGPVSGKRILLPRSEIARRAIADDLRQDGAVVDDIPVYHTLPENGKRPDLTGVDAVTFTSSSTVKNFIAAGPVPAGAKVVCIGPVTARTAREHGLEVTEVAGEYNEDGLVAALLAALR
jgi:uroporphyrinogen III methyltransferase / synthase